MGGLAAAVLLGVGGVVGVGFGVQLLLLLRVFPLLLDRDDLADFHHALLLLLLLHLSQLC